MDKWTQLKIDKFWVIDGCKRPIVVVLLQEHATCRVTIISLCLIWILFHLYLITLLFHLYLITLLVLFNNTHLPLLRLCTYLQNYSSPRILSSILVEEIGRPYSLFSSSVKKEDITVLWGRAAVTCWWSCYRNKATMDGLQPSRQRQEQCSLNEQLRGLLRFDWLWWYRWVHSICDVDFCMLLKRRACCRVEELCILFIALSTYTYMTSITTNLT